MTDTPKFDAWYYAHSCGRPYARDEEWLRFFNQVADRIVADVNPRTVLDAGCAMGLLVEALVDRGVDARGIDVSDYAIAQAPAAIRDRLRVGTLTQDLDARYDLIVSIEVLEHMPADEASIALANMTRHTDDVLFSSSTHDFGEATHVNVQPPEAWSEAFAREGMLRDVEYDASYITPWAVRYRRRTEPLPRLIRDYERVLGRLQHERNELRAQILRFDRDVQAEAAEAPRLRLELARVNTELLKAQRDLLALRDQVAHMEQSWFWRLRGAVRSIGALFGGSR